MQDLPRPLLGSTSLARNSAARSVFNSRTLCGLLLAAVVEVTSAACVGPHDSDAIESTRSLLSTADILGFESTSGWTVSSGSLRSSPDRTQGLASLAVVSPVGYTTIVSGPIGSASALASELVPSGVIPIDVKLPVQQPSPWWYGALQMFINCPSRGIYNAYLGQSELTGTPLDRWQTYSFGVPDYVGNALQGQSYTDLTITLVLNLPSSGTGTYLLDALGGTPVSRPPADAYTMPARTYVLPVLLVPSDYRTHAPDPDGIHDLAGGLWNTSSPGYRDFYAARNNMSVVLHQARAFYDRHLQNPSTQASRGTFSMATWNPKAKAAFVITAAPVAAPQVEPLIVRSSWSRASLTGPTYDYMGEVLAAAGCPEQATCPFRFVIMGLGDPFGGGGARPLNLGTNNGGGVVLFDFSYFAALGNYPPGLGAAAPGCNGGNGWSVQSSLIHELGHCFSLHHLNDYFDDDYQAVPSSETRFNMATSDAIMSYNQQNWICNCQADSANLCRYDQTWVDNFPGIMIPEEIRQLAQNQAAFPGLVFEKGLDAPGQTLYRSGSWAPMFIQGYGRLDIGGDSAPSNVGPYVIFRSDQIPFPQSFEPYHAGRAWLSPSVGVDAWASLTLTLPAPIQVTRLDVYSGTGSASTLTGIRVWSGSDLVGSNFAPGLNQAIALSGTASSLRVEFRAPASGQVAVRGLRLWGRVNGVEAELYPAAEPRITGWQESSGAPAGSVANLVGSTATMQPFSSPFNPALEWSGTTNSAGLLWLNIEFPEEVTVASMTAHTGSNSTIALAADTWQVTRRCICPVAGKPTDDSTCAPGNSGCAPMSPDGGALEVIVSGAAGGSPDAAVIFTPRTARKWNVAFHSRTARTRLVVRGIRFFAPTGEELFPSRSVQL